MALATTAQASRYPESGCLYMAIELSARSWRLAFSPDGERIRERSLSAGGWDLLKREIVFAKRRFGLAEESKVISCYEAGRDGFWIHRYLTRAGVENVVVDAASMRVDRRARRSKTDRIDVRRLLADLVRYARGEVGVWKVVRVPSEAEEDARRPHRELGRLKKERTQHRARILSLLATQGVRPSQLKEFLAKLDEARIWDGSPLPPELKAEVKREADRLSWTEAQIRSIQRQQRQRLKQPDSPQLHMVKLLTRLNGIGVDSAWMLMMEFFGWRQFSNRGQVGGAAGLGGSPYSSGSRDHEQGISKAGNVRVRVRMIELAWLWIRLQPHSHLTQWYLRRFADGGPRQRRIGIVAVARRLLIALWHFVEHGVIPPGAVLTFPEVQAR